MATEENILSDLRAALRPITVRRIEDMERLRLPHPSFARELRVLEGVVYDFMRQLTPDYRGGIWQFFEVSNGAFYMAPEHQGTFRFSLAQNGCKVEMSADAAGITACLFAYKHLAPDADHDLFDVYFQLLLEFAGQHAEAWKILAAIG